MRTFSALIAAVIISALPGCVRRAVGPLPGAQELGEEPPPGMVEVSVVSDYEDQVWDVYSGGQLLCSTPCTQWIGAGHGLLMRASDGDELFVRGLGNEAVKARRAVVVAEGTCHGKLVNGIVFTTLGGMGIVTAITLTAVGCSNLEERRGTCNAGLITGAASVPLTAAALWMLLDAGPKAHVLPVFRARAGRGQPPVTFALAPNGIAGTF